MSGDCVPLNEGLDGKSLLRKGRGRRGASVSSRFTTKAPTILESEHLLHALRHRREIKTNQTAKMFSLNSFIKLHAM